MSRRLRQAPDALRRRKIHFVKPDLLREWPDIEQLTEADVDHQAERFRGGANNWIVQTFLHLAPALAAQQIECSLSPHFVRAAVNVAHRDALNRVRWIYLRSFVVGIRADRPALSLCDFEILQNTIAQPLAHQACLPLWPQPGLRPRARQRGATIQRMAYFGRTGTAAAWLTDPHFHAALRQLGIEFEIREDRWFDYSDVDVVLAHRLEAPVMLQQKPASKLINAWLAGTPALLGDEPAFAQLRQSALDYWPVSGAQDVLQALAQLQAQPQHYLAMVANGQQRGGNYSVQAVRNAWLDVLARTIEHDQPHAPVAKRLTDVWQLLRLGYTQRQNTARFRRRYALERARMVQHQTS